MMFHQVLTHSFPTIVISIKRTKQNQTWNWICLELKCIGGQIHVEKPTQAVTTDQEEYRVEGS